MDKEVVVKVKELLYKVNVKVLGVVLNNCKLDEGSDYYYYYGVN